MSFRGLLVGAFVLCVLAGAVYWSERHEAAEDAKGSDAPKLVSIKDEEVQRVEILRSGQPPTILERDKSNNWQLTAPQTLRVDSDSATSVVSTFTGLAADRVVEEKAADLSQFGLSSPDLQVGVTTRGGNKRVLAIGDETPTSGSFYAKLDGDPRVFTVFSGTKSSFDKTASDLRDKRLLTFSEEKLSRLELHSKGSVEFGKNAQNEWQIVKPRPLRADNYQVEDLVRKVKEAQMETGLPEDEAQRAPSRFANGVRVAVVNATDASGRQTLEIRKFGEDYYARSSATEGTYKVAKDLGDSLNKGLDDFRNKKLFDFGFSDPSKVEIRDGDKRYQFVKGGEKWWANGKQMDATSVQSLIDKLRDLTTTKFVDSGFTTPVLEIAVTSNDGKRTEKVLISKTGNTWLAKRENEPSIYELDPNRVEEIQRAAADVKAPPPPAPTK